LRHTAALAVALAVLLLAGCGNETNHDVRVSIEQISSIASEGSLMADDLARGRTKTTYVRVHGEELSSQAEHEAEKLNDAPVDPALHERIDKAIGLSSEIGGAIDDMRVSPQDRHAAQQAQQNLEKWAEEARKIADSI
jgi:outer membrane murein-binding lipoprotein Lpp